MCSPNLLPPNHVSTSLSHMICSLQVAAGGSRWDEVTLREKGNCAVRSRFLQSDTWPFLCLLMITWWHNQESTIPHSVGSLYFPLFLTSVFFFLNKTSVGSSLQSHPIYFNAYQARLHVSGFLLWFNWGIMDWLSLGQETARIVGYQQWSNVVIS